MTTGENGENGKKSAMNGTALALLTLALSLAHFMQILDFTIANVSIPAIAGSLGASTSQATWVITSYGVASAICVPITGWLAKRFGEVRLFLFSTLSFSALSLLCGLAPNLESLIFFRVLQGIAGAPAVPLSQSLLLHCYPREKHALALALWATVSSVAPVIGPLLGGFISDNFYWGWIFLINAPLGLVIVGICVAVLRGKETPRLKTPVNYVGLALLVIGVGALQLMLDLGKEENWFQSDLIIILSIVAVVGISFLVAWELTDKHPILELKLFTSRNFTIALACTSLGMMLSMGAAGVLLPLLLQTRFGYTASMAGMVTAPAGLVPFVLLPFLGKYAHRMDMRILTTISFVGFAVAMFMRSYFAPNIDLKFLLVPQMVQGFAVTFMVMPLTSIAFSGLKPEQLAGAASLYNFIRMLCGSIGVSLVTALWQRRETIHYHRLAEQLSPFNPLVEESLNRLEGLGLNMPQSLKFLSAETLRQASILSAAEIYAAAAMGFLLVGAMCWLVKIRPNNA